MPVYAYLLLSFVLFLIGTSGVILRRNALIVLMSIELQLNAGNLAFLSFARALGDQKGNVFTFFVIALAALGLPGLNGFVGEFLIMLGAWSAFLPLALGAGLGVILAAWYVLRVYQGAFEEVPVQPAAFAELRPLEIGALAPLLALIVVFGVIPSFFPATVDATVRAVLRA